MNNPKPIVKNNQSYIDIFVNDEPVNTINVINQENINLDKLVNKGWDYLSEETGQNVEDLTYDWDVYVAYGYEEFHSKFSIQIRRIEE